MKSQLRLCLQCLCLAAVATTASAQRGALNNVPEAANYTLVYSLDIPDAPNYGGGVTYNLDLRNYISGFTRVAYYLELQQSAGPLNYVWVSMDAFTSDVNQIGVPTVPSGAFFQQPLANMNVASSVAGVVTGTGLQGGNMEFWPYNYETFNSALVPNASDSLFDWGDRPSTGGNYGSMQLANAEASQMLFAFNHWGGVSGIGEVGIGNNPAPGGQPDYTFAGNAAGYAVKTLQVYVIPAINIQPVLVDAVAETGLTNVIVNFSKAVEDDATNTAHYALSGGLTILKASLDPINKVAVTLTTSLQQPLTSYTLTVNGVRDRTSAHLEIPANSSAVFRSSIAGRGATNNVPEAANYKLVYSLDIPNVANYANGVTYNIDQRADVASFSRIAYYLELQQAGGDLNYLWASMDAFTTDVSKIGVPTLPSGAFFQQPVANLNVASSVAGIVAGTSMPGGNLEFWPINYETTNSAAVPNASDTLFDWGDRPTPGNYGSMQLHNAEASQVLFAFNSWGGNNNTADLGIGTNPTPGGQPDWTFMGNASSYSIKTLQVYVLPIYDTNRPTILKAVGVGGLTNVVLTFSKPLDDSASNAVHYALDGGLNVLSASLDPVTKASVTLTTTIQQPKTTYTVTVNGVFERSGSHTPIAPNSTVTFISSLTQGAAINVPEAANYALVYSLNIPNAPNYAPAVTYDLDLRSYLSTFTRVAYYLELQQNGGPLNYVWVSMDAFTADINQIGVPTVSSGVVWQQPVANMNVASSVAGVVNGTGLTGGNLEFWPYNYGPINAALVPNASDALFDWGDTADTGGNYGSMQIANSEASQMLIAFNRWGGTGGIADLGIGNNPAPGSQPDWTFANNAASYAVKTLQVFVLPTSNNNPPVLVGAAGKTGLTTAVLTFSKALEDDATNIIHYAVSGGVTVTKATLDPATRLMVTLTTSAQQPLTSYTVTVNGVRDQTPAHLTITPNSTATFRSSIAGRGATLNVAEAAKYTLVYSLDIPDVANYRNGVTYTIDQHAGISGFTRIAYYLELQEPGKNLDFLWASVDAFTTNVNQIGVPTVPSGAVFQQPLANLNVASSVASIVIGTNLAGGNIEFWPTDYTSANGAAVPNASDTLFDWGDTRSTGGQYGSMQLHNAGASQVLFAFNNWGGNNGIGDVGIGNYSGANPDWTFAGSAANYAIKTLQVYALATQTSFKILSNGFPAAGKFSVTCEAQSGSAYSLWRKLDVTSTTWTKVAEGTATGATITLVDTQATNRAGFYRVQTP